MQSKANEYRDKAAQAERLVALVHDEHAKRLYSDLAKQWRELANALERRETDRSQA